MYIYIYLFIHYILIHIHIYIYTYISARVCVHVCVYFGMGAHGPMAFHGRSLQHSCFLGPLPTEGCRGCLTRHGVALLGLRQC